MWTGHADVLFTSYVPLQATSWFYLGVILFAVGALVVVCIFFGTLVVAKRERTYQGSRAARHLRRDHRGDHRRHHARPRRGDLHPDLPVVARPHEGRSRDLPHGVVGAGPRLAADQRGGDGVGLVPARRPHHRRRGAEREGQPRSVRPLHPVHLDGVGPPPARGSRPGSRVEGVEHELLHVHGRARLHGPRLHGAGGPGGRPAGARPHQGHVRVAAQGAVGRSGLRRA